MFFSCVRTRKHRSFKGEPAKDQKKLDNKDIQIPSKHNKIYYTLPLLDYMFRLPGVIIRSSSEQIQNYLIGSLEGLMMTPSSRNMQSRSGRV